MKKKIEPSSLMYQKSEKRPSATNQRRWNDEIHLRFIAVGSRVQTIFRKHHVTVLFLEHRGME
jgi:hypothetical protein